MARKRLGEILTEKGIITQEELLECLEEQKFTREYLGAILLKKNLITQEALTRALSEQFGMPYLQLKNLYIDWNVCLRFSSVVVSQGKFLPIGQSDAGITVVMSDPLDVIGIDRIEEIARPKKLKLALVTPQELEEFLMECRKRARAALKNTMGKMNE
ncbi:MAG TPA: hypothetical protein DCL35_06255 [Candidatus Omnitrophica bacterium]|nr:hypothetical protein [Candidatus Omnitrophota bacterium]